MLRSIRVKGLTEDENSARSLVISFTIYKVLSYYLYYVVSDKETLSPHIKLEEFIRYNI